MLTEADKYFLTAALRENKLYHLATEWYLNFIPLPYQYKFHHVPQKNVTFMAGIGAGKTISVAASILIDCLTIPYFKALTTSVTAKQAELMYNQFQMFYEDNERLKHLIYDIKQRPWPMIIFQNYSTWEFRTCGSNAQFIRGFEYDRIAVDEAALLSTDEAIKVLRGRMRGRRPDGTVRMARLDLVSSPTGVPWFRDYFEKGWKDSDKYDPSAYYSIKATTFDNTYLTEEQIELIKRSLTDEEIDVEMMANFPDYSSSMFPRSHIIACTDNTLYDVIYEALYGENGDKSSGYRLEEHPRHGITLYEVPRKNDHIYAMAGDPGSGSVPKRNAACVIVADITQKPFTIVYFHWISGEGSYMPFLQSYKYAIEKYEPTIKIIDTSSTQKAIQELGFTEVGIETDGISFNSNKEAMLNTLSVMITNHELRWPFIKGLDKQLSTYSLEKERKKDFPNDIVMTLAMLAYGTKFTADEVVSRRGYRPSKFNPYPRKIRTNYGRRRL